MERVLPVLRNIDRVFIYGNQLEILPDGNTVNYSWTGRLIDWILEHFPRDPEEDPNGPLFGVAGRKMDEALGFPVAEGVSKPHIVERHWSDYKFM